MKKILFVLSFLHAYSVQSASISVSSVNNTVVGSLRAAVTTAPSNDVITLSSYVAGQPITLLSTLENPVNKNLIIDAITTPASSASMLPADIDAAVTLNCGMTEAQAMAAGGAKLTFNGSSYYIGYRQVSAQNQNPIMLKYTGGVLDWCREDYETTNDDGTGYGLFWSGTELYGVFSATGTQAGDNYTRFTTSGWLTSYGQGGGAKVSIILKINTTTGAALLNNGTYIKALLSNGNANTLVVNDIYLNGDNNLVVRADSYFSPMNINRTRMTQIVAGGSPHDYTVIFTPNLQTAVCASAVGWDNGTGIDCSTIVPTPCPDVLLLSGAGVNDTTYKAAIGIESNQVINVSTTVIYQTGGYTLLKPGFETKSGAVFKTQNGGCL